MEVLLKMAPIDWIVFWLSIVAYIPLIMGILKNRKDKSQSFTTWALYFLLDMITMLSTNKVDGNFVILFGFAVGSFVMAIILLFQGRIDCTKREIFTTTLVILCILGWYISGPLTAVILGIISESIIGIYLIYRTFKYPSVKYNLTGYIIFLIVSIVSLSSAKNTNIEQIGYPICEIILTSITLIPLVNKWWRNKVAMRY